MEELHTTKLSDMTEEELLKWVQMNMPFAIKPVKSKKPFVSSFKSGHAFSEVCKHFATKLNEKLKSEM